MNISITEIVNTPVYKPMVSNTDTDKLETQTNIERKDEKYEGEIENKVERNKKQKNINAECYEMSQIRYKTNKLNKTKKNKVVANIEKSNIEHLLQPNNNNDNKPWNKLSKNHKKQMFKQYAETKDNSKQLLQFLNNCLEKQKLTKNKDISYNSVERKIEDIPFLEYIPKRKMFTLRNTDKKDTTLKNLTRIKRRKPKNT